MMYSDQEVEAALAAFNSAEGESLPTGSVIPPSGQERMRAALNAVSAAYDERLVKCLELIAKKAGSKPVYSAAAMQNFAETELHYLKEQQDGS
jgi:hypothetical protein